MAARHDRDPIVKAERVADIVRRMADGQWTLRGAASQRAHAKRWGVSIDVARREAGEASRQILSTLRVEQAADAVAVLQGVMARHARGDHNEVRNALKAAELLTRLGGTERKELDLRTQLLGMSVPERRAWLERQAATIASILAELPQ